MPRAARRSRNASQNAVTVKDKRGNSRPTTVSGTQERCESRGGRPGLPVLMSLMVSVDVKQH